MRGRRLRHSRRLCPRAGRRLRQVPPPIPRASIHGRRSARWRGEVTVARKLRVDGEGGSWDAELEGTGVTLSDAAGTFAIADEGDGRFAVSGPGGERQAI